MHCYLPFSAFLYGACSGCQISNVLSYMSGQTVTYIPWAEVKRLVDMVHKHLCGHDSYTDLKTFLKRNEFWSESVGHYVENFQKTCAAYKSTSQPQKIGRSLSRRSTLDLTKSSDLTICTWMSYIFSMRWARRLVTTLVT